MDGISARFILISILVAYLFQSQGRYFINPFFSCDQSCALSSAKLNTVQIGKRSVILISYFGKL